MDWNKLDFWKSGEWQVVEERLHDTEKAGIRVIPSRDRLFRAMDLTPFADCRVCIVAQDPYPDPNLATGIALSVPDGKMSKTLEIIFNEYEKDLKLPRPRTGNLESWSKQGVFLWNAFPSRDEKCSHMLWHEWTYLTTEIIEKLDDRGGCVFVFLGNYARQYARLVKNSPVIETSHPSPLGHDKTKTPFTGSRLFTKINGLLEKPIDWRL